MASTTGRRVVVPLTNKSGGGVILGDVVIVDTSNDSAFTTTTSAGSTATVGVVQETIASNATGLVLLEGETSLVLTSASVTRGHYGTTHTVAKQAVSAGASRTVGTFVQFMTGGTTPKGIVFPVDLAGATGAVATDAIWDAAGDTVVGSGANTAVKRVNNPGTTVAPTVNEDSGDGYAIGSRWFDTTADQEYVALDVTVGAAVWRQTTTGAWAAFTPTWTCAGTAPSLGNGTVVGRYKYLDAKTIAFYMTFTAGSTSTYGTFDFRFALPATAASNGRQILAGHILDNGTDNKVAVGIIESGGTYVALIIPEGGNVVDNATPMTWATGDQLSLSGVYEVA